MALIKSSRAEQAMRDVIVLDLGDLSRQADELKAQARAEAQRIIEQGKGQAHKVAQGAEEAGRQRGEKAGYEQGLAEGRKTGHAEALARTDEQLGQLQKAWSEALGAWEAQRRQMILDANQSLMELAVTLSRKIIHRVPQVDPQAVADQVAAAVDYVARPSRIAVRINPADRPVVEQALPGIVDQAIQVTGADIVDDPTIKPGGCVITYGRGRIDATLDKQLDRMVQTMLPDERRSEHQSDQMRLNDPEAAAGPQKTGQDQGIEEADPSSSEPQTPNRPSATPSAHEPNDPSRRDDQSPDASEDDRR